MRLLLFAPIPIQIEAAKRRGYHVTSLWQQYPGANPYAHILADVRQLSDTYIEGDLLGGEDWIASVARVFDAYPETVLIPGPPDEFLPAFLKLAETVGRLPHSRATYEPFRSKVALRDLLARDTRLALVYRAIRSGEDLKASRSAGIHILKPACSSGSKNVAKLESDADWDAAIAHWGDGPLDLVLEEHLDGPQFSVEIVSREGRHEVLGVTEKNTVHPPHYIENGGVFPAPRTLSETTAITEAALRFLDLAKFRNGPTHTEVILTARGPKIVESNARLGGLIPFLIRGAHDRDAYAFIFDYLAGREDAYRPRANRVAALGIFEFEAGRTLNGYAGLETLNADPHVVKFNTWAPLGVPLVKPRHNEQRHGYVVVVGDTADQARARVHEANETIAPVYA